MWQLERNQLVLRSLGFTVRNGELLLEKNPVKIFIRDWMLWFMRLIPSLRFKQENPTAEKTAYEYVEGMAFLPEMHGGVLLPQVYCRAMDVGKDVGGKAAAAAPVAFTDDFIFGPGKRGLFQLVVLLDCVEDISDARIALSRLEISTSSEGYVLPGDVTYIIHDISAASVTPLSNLETKDGHERVVRVASGDEFAASPLCKGRPEPVRYDAYRLRNELGGKRFVILRPDRFVFAACKDSGELESALGKIGEVLGGVEQAQ